MHRYGKCVPWYCESYNDEVTLFNLRTAQPTAFWRVIQKLFNQAVPVERRRSVNSIRTKWSRMQSRPSQLETIKHSKEDVSLFESLLKP